MPDATQTKPQSNDDIPPQTSEYKRTCLTTTERNLLFYLKQHQVHYPKAPCFIPAHPKGKIGTYTKCIEFLAENQYILLSKTSGHYRTWTANLNNDHPKIKELFDTWK